MKYRIVITSNETETGWRDSKTYTVEKKSFWGKWKTYGVYGKLGLANKIYETLVGVSRRATSSSGYSGYSAYSGYSGISRKERKRLSNTNKPS